MHSSSGLTLVMSQVGCPGELNLQVLDTHTCHLEVVGPAAAEQQQQQQQPVGSFHYDQTVALSTKCFLVCCSCADAKY
jgi:hypothetical protein